MKGTLQAMRFLSAVDMARPDMTEGVSRELWMRIWSKVYNKHILTLTRLSRSVQHKVLKRTYNWKCAT